MIILQIHFGVLSRVRLECVESVRRVYGDCDYRWIDDENRNKYVETMMTDLEIKDLPPDWDLSSKSADTLRKMVSLSDWLRFWMCSQINDLLYIDTDMRALERYVPTAEPGTPAYYWYDAGNSPISDYCAIYSNASKPVFDRWLYVKKKEAKWGPWLDVPRPCHPNMIPAGCFQHLRRKTGELHWTKNE